MRKLMFLCLFLLVPSILNAECDYKTEKNMTSLSLYVDYSYEYIEESKTFNIYIYNLQNIFAAEYNMNTIDTSLGKGIITGIKPGENITLNIFGSGVSECSSKSFRIIYISVPYINPYYGSKECNGYEKTTVCYSKFLNFEISNTTFRNALKREEDKNKKEELNENVFLNIFKFIRKYYIKIIISLCVTIITILMYKNKYRKSKHGF